MPERAGEAMEEYNFWADLLRSYRDSPDIIKALWVLAPPGFVLGLVAVVRLTRRKARRDDEIVYMMTRDSDGVVRMRRDAAAPEHPALEYDAGEAEEPSARSPSR